MFSLYRNNYAVASAIHQEEGNTDASETLPDTAGLSFRRLHHLKLFNIWPLTAERLAFQTDPKTCSPASEPRRSAAVNIFCVEQAGVYDFDTALPSWCFNRQYGKYFVMSISTIHHERRACHLYVWPVAAFMAKRSRHAFYLHMAVPVLSWHFLHDIANRKQRKNE